MVFLFDDGNSASFPLKHTQEVPAVEQGSGKQQP